MKYLAIAREFNEPDNNTPADIISAKIVETPRLSELEKEFSKLTEADFSVMVVPIDELKDWKNIIEIW